MSFRLGFGLFLGFVTATASAARFDADTLQRALQAPPGTVLDLPLPAHGTRGVASMTPMRRIDVLAPGAKTYVVDAEGRHELPASGWRHYVADPTLPGGPRYGLSISPDGREAIGVLFSGEGSFSIRGQRERGALVLEAAAKPRTDEHGNPVYFACELDGAQALDLGKLGLPSREEVHAALDDAGVPKATAAASRSATVAVDTDTELLSLKFSGSTANATTYLDALFVGMNVIYERDIDVTLLRGTTYLRTASDPYTTTSASSTIDQLDEFGEEWMANESLVSRAFAAQISGKSSNANSSAGVAWLIGASNMCTQKGSNFASGICSDGTCTAGHYSISRVFRFAGSTAAHDVLVVAHELGHNFGVNHTHCTDASTGAQPVSSGTIDQCYSGESGAGCYGGATSCPAAQTINGVTNVTGTLMSYCHITPAGCDSFEVFHPRNSTSLNTVATNNVGSLCFTTGGGSGTFTIANASLTEGDAGTSTMNFSVTRTGGSGSGSVTATTSAGTATAGTDYVHKTQAMTFASAGSQNFSVTINGDLIDEVDETLTVALSAQTAGFTLGSPSSATGTITDNDTSSLSVNDPAAVTEGSSISFTVSMSNANSRTVTVTRATANGTANSSDYTSLSAATLTFNAGETSKTVIVNTTDDALDEPSPETFTLNLSGVNSAAVIGDASGTGSINDNEPTPTISVADAAPQAEDNGNSLRYVISLSGPSQSTITVRADTANGTATAPSDYQARANVTVTFSPGITSQNFDVTKVVDAVIEPDETVLVNLSNASAGASILDGSATGTIVNDDGTEAPIFADGFE